MSDRPPNRFMATTMENKVTPRQLGAIRAIANKQRVDEEKLCQRLRGCKPEEMNSRAASVFIAFLQTESAKVLNFEIERQEKLAALMAA